MSWTYKEDIILLDESISKEEKETLLEGRDTEKRRRFLQRHNLTINKLNKEQKQIIDIYPDYPLTKISEYTRRPYYYIQIRRLDLDNQGLLRTNKLLTEKHKEYITENQFTKKATWMSGFLNIPTNLIKMVIFENYKELQEVEKKSKLKDKKLMNIQKHKPPNALIKSDIEKIAYKDNCLYEIMKPSRAKGDNAENFKGVLIYQDEDFILLKHKLGYKECFIKVDFKTGEYLIEEIGKWKQ